MPSFGIIAEGPCDQIVIENILIGCFPEPVVNHIQPPPAPPSSPGGWTLVFESLKRGDPQKSLQFNDYVVIHIDTDVQEEIGFDVPRREGGKELSVAERVDRVIARLTKDIDPAVLQAAGNRILFAIAVDSIECWLLPLLYDDDTKAGKTTGCLNAANHELRRRKEDGLGSDDKKFTRAYEQASKPYRKRKMIDGCRNRNPSLELFVNRIDALSESRPPATDH